MVYPTVYPNLPIIYGFFYREQTNDLFPKGPLEFSPNVFTEFAEFSDKKGLLYLKINRIAVTHYLLCRRQMQIPLYHKDIGNREDPKIESNSCFSDLSDPLNSLNSMKVLLHSGRALLNWI